MVSDVALRDVVEQLGGELLGDGALRIERIGPLERATPATLSFLANPRYQSQLAESAAACVIVAPALREAAQARGAVIITPDPYLYFARLTQWWAARSRAVLPPGIHPRAVVDASAQIAASASVGPLTVVEAGALIGERAVIGAQCFIGAGASVGADTRFAAQVTLGTGCVIGERCIVHSGTVIGADGFGFAPNQGRWEKIEQLGAVRIGNDVELGANVCIDRGALEDTVVEDGVKLDNMVQIAHNVRIGAHTAMAAASGVAGSSTVGKHCTVGGAGVILGHLTLGDHINISATSVVMRSIRQPGTYSGIFPIDDNVSWEKNAATLRQLHSLRDRIRQLEKAASGTKT